MNQANSASCNNQGIRGNNKAVLIAETALHKEKIAMIIIPNCTFLVCFGSISEEFGRATVRIFARPLDVL